MLPIDITLNASDSVPLGTAGPATYSLIGGGSMDRTVRSDASVALTVPRLFTTGHLQRKLKGFKSGANITVGAPDVIVDRHMVRLDNCIQAADFYDPDRRLTTSVQLVIEVPRLGTNTPSLVTISDRVKMLVSVLTINGNAHLSRILNNES